MKISIAAIATLLLLDLPHNGVSTQHGADEDGSSSPLRSNLRKAQEEVADGPSFLLPAELLRNSPALVGNVDGHINRELSTSGDQRACKYEVAGSTRDAVVALALSLVGQPLWFCWSNNGQSLCNNRSCPSKLGGQRWYGIDGYICPVNKKVPPCVDCSSFVTWVYWTAFGLGADKLNGAIPKWTYGSTYTMMEKGKPVDNWQVNIKPGDLVFTNSGNHVQIYVGNNQVVDVTGSYSQSTTVKKSSIKSSGVHQVRTYFGTSSNLF